MAYANFKPTIWSKKIQMDLDKFMVWKDICNTKFQGEVGRGKTVKIVGIGKPTVRTYTPGTAINTPETPSDRAMNLLVDQYKYTNFMVDDVDDAQAHVDIMEYLMKGSASALAETADTFIATTIGTTTVAASAGGKGYNATTGAAEIPLENVSSSTAITTAKAAKKVIDDAFVALWNQGVKTGKDTYIVVSPWFYSEFKNDLTEILTNNVDMVNKGIFGMYNGCPVKMSNNLYNDGTDDYVIVCTKDAVAFADGIESVEPYRPETLFSDAVKVLHTYGAKVVRAEQVAICKVHQ